MSKLSHSDHKSIAMGIVQELHKVLSDHAGGRLLDKHKARTSPADPAQPEDDDDMAMMADEPTGEHALPGVPGGAHQHGSAPFSAKKKGLTAGK